MRMDPRFKGRARSAGEDLCHRVEEALVAAGHTRGRWHSGGGMNYDYNEAVPGFLLIPHIIGHASNFTAQVYQHTVDHAGKHREQAIEQYTQVLRKAGFEVEVAKMEWHKQKLVVWLPGTFTAWGEEAVAVTRCGGPHYDPGFPSPKKEEPLSEPTPKQVEQIKTDAKAAMVKADHFLAMKPAAQELAMEAAYVAKVVGKLIVEGSPEDVEKERDGLQAKFRALDTLFQKLHTHHLLRDGRI